jgi:ribosomal protein L7/L12
LQNFWKTNGAFLPLHLLQWLPLLQPAATPVLLKKDTRSTVVLGSAGDQKINVIKEVRAITGLGLKEAKEMVEGAPKDLKENVPTAEANELKEKLEGVGATVELK